MNRVQYHRYGGPEVLELEEFTLPAPGRGQIRIRIKAAAANPMDWKIRKGEMKMMTGRSFPRGLGHDFAGVVEAVGLGVERLKVNDEVFGVTGLKEAGTLAEAIINEEKMAFLKPRSLSFEEAAALPIVAVTAWNALIEKANVQAGQRVFIAGCLGGVGRIALQLAVMRGAEVVGSCNASRCGEAMALGAGEVVDYHCFDMKPYLNSFDVVFDTVGVLSPRQCGKLLKRGGMSLHIVPTPAKMIWSLLPTRHHVVFGNATLEAMAGITDAVERGKLAPAIGRVAPLSEAIPAIIELETKGSPKGKLVFVP